MGDAGALRSLDQSLDEALLTAGLLRAGLGFGAGVSFLALEPRAGLGFGADGSFLTHGPALAATGTVADVAGGGAVPVGGSPLSSVQQAVPLEDRGSGGGGSRKLMPLAGYGSGPLLVKPPSFTFAPPVVTAAGGGRPLAAFSDSYLSTTQISLHETLTNRTAFLRGELME